jgi:hypothetical protein
LERSGWVVDYRDGQGKCRLKTFKRKKEADAFESAAVVEVRDGVHVADSATITVNEARMLWTKPAARRGWSDRRSTSTASTWICTSHPSSARRRFQRSLCREFGHFRKSYAALAAHLR